MKKSQFFAVSQWLTDWPEGYTFDEVIEMVANDDFLSITKWEMVEDWDADDLAETIVMTEKAFRRAVADILNEEEETTKPLKGAFGSPFPANFLSIRK